MKHLMCLLVALFMAGSLVGCQPTEPADVQPGEEAGTQPGEGEVEGDAAAEEGETEAPAGSGTMQEGDAEAEEAAPEEGAEASAETEAEVVAETEARPSVLVGVMIDELGKQLTSGLPTPE